MLTLAPVSKSVEPSLVATLAAPAFALRQPLSLYRRLTYGRTNRRVSSSWVARSGNCGTQQGEQ